MRRNTLRAHLIVIMFVLANVYTVGAAAQRWPGRIWQVKSSYHSPIAGKDLPSIIWSFTAHSDQSVSVQDVDQRIGCTARLTFAPNGALVTAEYFSQIRDKEMKIKRSFDAQSPAVFEDSLIPCDWINVTLPWDGECRHFSVMKRVGKSASFATNIRMIGEKIDVHEAVDREMISSTQVRELLSSKSLVLVRIEKIDKNREGQEILRQLWSADVPFWLYEATPFRQSWYIVE